MHTRAIENAICAYICERQATDPATYFELAQIAAMQNPSLTEPEVVEIVHAMIEAGKIEAFEDDERGTVYVRDC